MRSWSVNHVGTVFFCIRTVFLLILHGHLSRTFSFILLLSLSPVVLTTSPLSVWMLLFRSTFLCLVWFAVLLVSPLAFLTRLLFNFCFFRSRTFILLHLLFSSSLFCLSFWIIFHKVSVDVVLKIILSLDHHLHVIQNFIIRVFLLPIFLNDLLILFWLNLLRLCRLLKVRLYLTFLNIVVILHHTCELDDLTPYL